MTENQFPVFGTQFTVSTVIALLGHALERWIPATAAFPAALKRSAYWLIGAGTAIGVHAAFSSETGTLVVTGLTLAGVAHGLWHWVQSVALQEFVHGATRPASGAAVRNPYMGGLGDQIKAQKGGQK